MKIVSLQAENFKRLSAVQITPAGNLVEITGDNAQGKSSILDAIWAAIGGKAAGPVQPVRRGEEVAMIRVDLGEMKVTRKFINKDDGKVTTSLTVENADGHRLSPPQEILNRLTSALTFDPLEFSRRSARDQAIMLRGLVPQFDFEAAERDIAKLADKRKDIGRELKQAEAELKAVPVPDNAPEARIDTQALVSQLGEAADTNQRINLDRLHREQSQAEIDDARTQVSDINKQIAVLKQQAETASQWADEQEQKLAGLPDLPELVDVQVLQDQLSAAEETNQIVQLVEKAAQLQTKVTGLETEHGEAVAKIQALRTQMAGAVAAANLPVDGLDFNDTGVNLNGLPFEQASQAEQLKTAIAIAVALDPELRVLRVRDGALLGTAAMDQLAAFSDQFDMQIWIETVESDRPAAILIEDGTIAAHAVEAAE